ncbi:hypothetical protein CSA80_05050 [Candidatus Saccharibacteria bacterium]|nr:MAG: hypothetical protein CSA80_05050 [Candidatus Saccharibacteria bacterium]
MAQDTDTDGFLGITYISHNDQNLDCAPAEANSNDQTLKNTKQAHAQRTNDEDLQAIRRELAALESRLKQYENETAERLDHLERLAGHPLSPEEKVYRIQEDS